MMKNNNNNGAVAVSLLVLIVLSVTRTISAFWFLPVEAFSSPSPFSATTTTTITTTPITKRDTGIRCTHGIYSYFCQRQRHRCLSLLLSSSSMNDNNNNIYDDDDDNTNRNGIMDNNTPYYSRRQVLHRSSTTTVSAATATATAAMIVGRGIGSTMMPIVAIANSVNVANAVEEETTNNKDQPKNKQLNLSNEDIMKIIELDLTENQFLVNGKLTRSIYDESATFQDEIDTYQLDKWIDGTSKLFDSQRSKVVLVDKSLQVMTDDACTEYNGLIGIELRFVEYLCFNIPFLKPIVYLSGTLILKRNPETGLIISYQEKWDQNIYEVLSKKSKLFSSSFSNQELDNELELFYKLNANNSSK